MAPPVQARRPRLTAAARREQLLDVAATLVLHDGFGAVTVEAIASRAGVTRAVIYQHFRDLEQLLRTLITRELTHAQAQVSETAVDDLTRHPNDRLLASLRAFLHAVHSHPITWRMVLLPPQGAPPALRRAITRGRDKVLAGLTSAINTAGDDGDSDAELTAHVLSAIADEYARLLLADPRQYPIERLLAHARAWLDQRTL